MTEKGKDLRQAAEEGKKALEEDEEALQKAKQESGQAAWQAAQLASELRDLEKTVTDMDKRVEALDTARSDIQADLVSKEKALSALEEEPETDIHQWQAAADAAKAEAERCRKNLTECQITAATLKEQVRHGEEQLTQHASWQDELTSQQELLAQRRKELRERRQTTERLLQELAQNIEVKKAETARSDEAKEAFYKSRSERLQQSHDLDELVDDLRRRSQTWQQRLNAADIQMEKYKSDISHHEERLAMQGLSRQEAMDRRREGSLKELHDKVSQFKSQITALGTINPAAEDDYQAALAKQEFYKKQCLDLEESREKLRAVVADIDKAMADQFGQAFQDIGVHFQQIFSCLFEGGTAHLALTDKEHILESGVEIYIRPPGKKQQSLTLLSGGERALTVIALLLAFLAFHPAPFCLVDEVDAALDEANVERMAKYLQNYSGSTQFIVITHRRKTMEAANTLLGVTMEEKGVSRLLSVKVDELLKEGT